MEYFKARKPSTITKTRERWTEDEHALFIEGLRMHGRAWRKIEEYIGTKSAIQIRSHAQKFFDKVERQKDSTNGEQSSEPAGSVDIPPPRPKRKPTSPYPRNRNCSFNSNQGGTVSVHCHQGNTSGLDAAAAAYQRASMSPMLTSTSGFAQAMDSEEVSEAMVAAVAAAASAAATAAAAAVVAAAGQEVQAYLQAHPPAGFPFFGLTPTLLAQIACHHQARQEAARARSESLGAPQQHSLGTGNNSHQQHKSHYQVKAMEGAVHLLGTLTEATGTTTDGNMTESRESTGTGSTGDGDSACSRETDLKKNLPHRDRDGGVDRTVKDAPLSGRDLHLQGPGSIQRAGSGSACALAAGGIAGAEAKGMMAPPSYTRRPYSMAQRSHENKAKPVSLNVPLRSAGGTPSSLTRGLAWDSQARLPSEGGVHTVVPALKRQTQEESSKECLPAPEALKDGNQADMSDGCGSSRRQLRLTTFPRNDWHKSQALKESRNNDSNLNPTSEEDNGSGGRGANVTVSMRETQGSNPTKGTGSNGSNGNNGSGSNGNNGSNGNGSNGNRCSGNENGSSGNEEGGGEELVACTRNGSTGDGNGCSGNGNGSSGNGNSGNGNGCCGNGNGSSGNGNDFCGNGNGSSGIGNDCCGNGNGCSGEGSGGGGNGSSGNGSGNGNGSSGDGNGSSGNDSGDGNGASGNGKGSGHRPGSSLPANGSSAVGIGSGHVHGTKAHDFADGVAHHSSGLRGQNYLINHQLYHKPSSAFQLVHPKLRAAAPAAESGAPAMRRSEAVLHHASLLPGDKQLQMDAKQQLSFLHQQVLHQLQILGAQQQSLSGGGLQIKAQALSDSQADESSGPETLRTAPVVCSAPSRLQLLKAAAKQLPLQRSAISPQSSIERQISSSMGLSASLQQGPSWIIGPGSTGPTPPPVALMAAEGQAFPATHPSARLVGTVGPSGSSIRSLSASLRLPEAVILLQQVPPSLEVMHAALPAQLPAVSSLMAAPQHSVSPRLSPAHIRSSALLYAVRQQQAIHEQQAVQQDRVQGEAVTAAAALPAPTDDTGMEVVSEAAPVAADGTKRSMAEEPDREAALSPPVKRQR